MVLNIGLQGLYINEKLETSCVVNLLIILLGHRCVDLLEKWRLDKQTCLLNVRLDIFRLFFPSFAKKKAF